jgi:single-strand DNA-binding protein
MYQKTIVVGYLGQDPEMRYMPNGDAVTNFSVATSRRWPNKDTGEMEEETTWFRCSAWRKSAETINQWFTKGKPILVEGRLKVDRATGGPRMYTRTDGTVGVSFELDVTEWRFMPGGDGESGGDGGSGYRPGTAAAQEEDEIPF